jgi:hypothetical protein
MQEVQQQLKNASITNAIVLLIAGGMDPVKALETVCGVAVTQKMISDVYETLRK